MHRKKSMIGGAFSRLMPYGLMVAVSLAVTDGFVSLIEAGDSASGSTHDLEQLDFIPNLPEGQCLYVNPDSRVALSFSARKGPLFAKLYNLALPEVIELDAGPVDIPVGTLPELMPVHCDIVDREKVTVLDSFEQAAAIVAPDVLQISARLHELADEYTFNERLVKRSVPHPQEPVRQ